MRDSKLIKLLCLVISLFLAVSLLGACAEQDSDKVNSTSSEDAVSSDADDDNVSSEPSDDDNDGEGDGEENGDWDDTADIDDGFDDISDDDSDSADDSDYYTEYLKVYNGEAPLNTDYKGMSASVYHAFGHIQDDTTGRVYTDEMMNLELSRLQDSGVRYCRTRYQSAWSWDGSTGGYNWDKSRVSDFYTYCKNLQDRGINVVLAVGWHLGVFTKIETGSISEVDYILNLDKYPTDIYGETTGYDYDANCKGNADYEAMATRALRFGYFYAETLRQCRARGINNISHFLYWTEPSYSISQVFSTRPDLFPLGNNDPAYGMEGPSPDEYMFIVDTVQSKLKSEGVYNMVKHVGPNQGSIQHGDGLLRYILEKGRTDMFDVWTAHFYPQATDSTNNVYFDIIDPVFQSYVQPLKDVGIYGKEEFWVDEFYCRSDKSKLGVGDPWVGLQMAVGGICAQQQGINNISLWQIFDQLWTDHSNTGGEFINGIHACGSAPSLFVSSIPREQYYSTGLFAKYNGYKNGKAYRTNYWELMDNASDIHVGAAQLEDGSWTITVVNAGIDSYNIEVQFDKAIYQTLYRHVNNVNTNVPTTAAHLADADKTFANVKDKFTDVIEGGCVAIYTGVKG